MLKEMEETTVSRSIDRLVLNASLAANRLEVMDQSQVDQAVAAMASMPRCSWHAGRYGRRRNGSRKLS